MDAVNDFLIYIDGFLGSAIWFPTFLLATGIFFTLYLGFPQIRYFRHAIGVTTGKFDKEGAKGDTSHFQALATALSGTCLLYTSPSPRDRQKSRMPSSA